LTRFEYCSSECLGEPSFGFIPGKVLGIDEFKPRLVDRAEGDKTGGMFAADAVAQAAEFRDSLDG
jgi:hypothetical protein